LQKDLIRNYMPELILAASLINFSSGLTLIIKRSRTCWIIFNNNKNQLRCRRDGTQNTLPSQIPIRWLQPILTMRKIYIFLFFVVINSIAFGQTIRAVHLADSLLKAGNLKAAITTYDFSKDIKDLQDKALTNLKNNPQWADKYIVVQVQKGATDIPKFLDAYGLTEEEFEKMINGFKAKKKAVFSDTTSISIKKSNGLITFQTFKKISLFNYLKIDTKKNVIYFDNFQVTKELPITEKFYAPILKGIETHTSEQINSLKNKTGITYFGLTLGVNSNDNRPTLCLIYGTGSLGETKFLTITII
jgi:hypothetical protein